MVGYLPAALASEEGGMLRGDSVVVCPPSPDVCAGPEPSPCSLEEKAMPWETSRLARVFRPLIPDGCGRDDGRVMEMES